MTGTPPTGSAGGAARPGLVHGLGKDLVPPDWPPLTSGEVRAVLASYSGGSTADITWHSPRPWSAAGVARWPGSAVFIKRHHVRVRSAGQLAAEHAFIGHLRDRGIPVPAVLRTRDGATTVGRGDFCYEVHELAGGRDVYRDAMSWTPFTSLEHARAAGAALARLHRAAASFRRSARPPGVLLSGCDIVLAPDPLHRLSRLLSERPGLAGYLTARSWRADLARHVLPAIRQAGPLLAGLPRQWGHGDWHPSNLTWTSAGARADVAGVFDFGLANRTLAVHDLATALERSTVSWLDLAESGQAAADLAAVDALLDGYQAVRPLSPGEAAALAGVFPVVHVEYALAEIEYFHHVVNAPGHADLAYHGYLLGHARWFGGPDGRRVLDHLRRRASWT
ncbi:MAG TPA: phosphotransferase [Streptosporangiaceae bacterium]|nr:phosphotransferase [Streptosporangiaceae bacterium]